MTPSQPESRLTALAEAVRSVLTDLSGIPAEDLASEASFLEQGFDSLLLTQLSKALQDEFKVEITLRSLMGDLSSIDAMVAYLDAKLPSDRFRPEPATPVTPPPSLAPQAAPAMSAPTPAPMLSAAAVPTPPAMPVALNGTIESVIAQQLELMRQQIALLQGGAAALPATPAPAAAPVPTTSAPAIPAPSSPSAPAAPSTKVASTGSSAPTTSINRSLDGSLTDRQRNHLDQLIANYVAKTRTSKELTAKYRQWYADPRTVSGFNRRWKEMVYQIAVQKSKGSRLIDVDGNEYIDLLNGFGPNFLGHAPEFITEALRAQLDCGFEVGPQSVTAMEAAQLFCEVTGNERASFVNTGSEAVQAAMRLSRTVTGRDKVVVFARDYHGNFDEMLVKGVGNGAELRSMPVAPGIPRRAVEDVIVLPYGTEEALQVIRARAHELAAVIVEPIQSRRPEFQPREFIHEVRNITRQSGTVFVFDEVITGFRTGPRGAQGYYGIEADIATYGKVVGGGMPLGVVAGKAQFMDTFDGGMWNYGDDSFPEKGVTFFAGTFVRHPLTMAATRAVLLHLKEKGPEFWQGIRDRANRLAQSVDKMFVETGAPLRMPNFGSQMFVRAAEDHPYANLLFFHLRHKGVFLLEGFPTYMTAAHTDEEIDYVIRAFTESVAELQDAGFFQPATGTSPLYLNGAGLSGPQRLLTANSTSVPSVVQAAPKPYPLTESLAEVWLASQIGGDASLCFNEIMLIDLHGEVKVPALRQALQDIAARHDSLRMAFRSDAEGFEVLPQVTIELAEVNLSAVAPDSRQAEFEQVLQEQRATPFDLTSGPLFRGVLVQLDREESTLILAAHHVACDGWSFKILIEETGQFYNARVQGTTPNLTPAPSYADYVVEAAGLEAKSEATREEAYWLSQFAEPVAPLNLPLDFPAAQDPDFLCGTVAEYLGPDLLRSLKKVAGQSGGTLFSLLLGAYQLLLSRISRQTRFVVWFPVAGQSEHHREDLVGHCVNALPFVTTIPAEGSFGSFVKANQNQLLDVLDHMDFTFGRLIKKLGPDQRPLMEAIFNYERMDGSVEMNGLRTEIREIERGFARNPLLLKTYETPSGLEVRFDFQSALFQASTVREWLETYRAILEGVAAQPHASVAEISAILSDNQWQRIRQWNLTETNYPRDCNLNELFEQTVQRRGGAIAIRSDQGELSYSTFSDMVGRVAYALTESGVAPGQRVGLFMERSPELIASILAVIKAGAAYVPMDPAYPAERTRYIVEDSGIKVVLTESDLLDRLPKEIVKLTVRDALKRGPSNRAPHRNSVGPDSPACVIYTSGSTGQPKGGILSHRNIVRLVRNTNMTEFGDDELILQLTTICFDPSLAEIFGSLMNGGSLVIPPAGQLTVDQIADRIIAHGVTQVFTTPALLHLLIDERIDAFHSLRRIFTGGDVPSPTQVRRILESHPRCAVVNAYGPTENTTITTMHVITASDLDGTGIPIGRPISNTTVWITDANGKPVPPGMPGELLTGGDGVAIGYLNRPELTTERFLADPYRDVSGARLYRTGDLCRFRPDGVIEFLGRIDQQVKIRGFRIELGEIENQLSRHPAVRLCRVLVRGTSPSDKFLVAYVAPVALATPSPTELGDYLRSKLPHFMVPAAFVLMENLPVNPNGKLDIHKLPMPETVVPSKAEELPSLPPSETERTLIELWKQILGVQSLGLDDDFFALGGHSLQGMKLFTRIQKAFGVALPLGRLFRAPTVRQLARLIDEQLGSGSMEETPALYPMTEPLAEVWLASQIGGNASLPFNEVNVLTMSGPLDQPALEGALQDLAARHDALRTVFLANGDGFEVRPVVRIPMRTVDLSPLPADAKEQGIEEAKSRQCLTPFDLAKGPLFRAELLKLGNEEHLLLLNAHHLACDGWSNQIVMRELAELYNARVDGKPASLKPAPSFAAYVLRASATEHAGPEQTFWLGQFAEPVQPLRLPLDFAARPDSDHHCDSVIQQIDPEKLIQLKRLAARSGATLFGLLFGVFQALLHRISRQQRFAVWFPAAGQSGIGHENQVGHCVNVLPLVGTVDPARSFREFLEQTQNGLLDALQHRNYTYGQLIKQSRRENRPTIEAVFNFEKLSDTLEMRGLMTRTREIDRRFASHPLFLKAYETTQGLEFRFDFQTSLFKRDNIREWLDTYSAMLDAFAADPSLQVKDVCAAMTESQANRLRTWNQTEVPFPSNDTLPGLFHITSKSHPNKTAIRFGEQTLSYAELEDMADRICLTLLGAGTKPGARVGIFLDRSPEMVASILGVLKTGATYVPIDPAYPADRTRYIIEDSGIDIVLSQQELFDRLPKENTVISLKQALKRSDSRNHPFPPMQDSDAAACVLYTSGSTGKPKGALIPHRAIVRLVRNTNFTVLDESEVLIQVASVCFDASLYEIFGALVNGGCLVIPPAGHLTVDQIAREIRTKSVTQTFLTSALFEVMVEECLDCFSGLRRLVIGGDIASPAHSAKFAQAHPQCLLVNGYGPTESTTFVTYHVISPEDIQGPRIPIGQPLHNSTVWIVDSFGNLVPPGIPGELLTGGAGVALGYLNRPDLTGERFLADRFSPDSRGRLYRSGDLCRFRADGVIEFLGRFDHQVKIRGFRIEPGEIENLLGRHPGVRQCKIVVRGDGAGDKVLIGYASPIPTAAPTEDELKDYLRSKLPSYMVPSTIVILPELPMNPNGKIDTHALPAPGVVKAAPGESLPPTATESTISELWKQVLGLSAVGLDDDFFAIGGHSLLGMKLFSGIQRIFGVSLPLGKLFRAPTVRQLARLVDADLATKKAVEASSKMIASSHLHPIWEASAPPIPARPTTALVPIQPKGDAHPVFAIHGGDGGILFYGKLSQRLGDDLPFFAFEAPALTAGAQIPEESVEQTAAKYLEELLKVQPRGPFNLCGYSFGGVVAYEIACRLAARGETIAFLGLIDTDNPAAAIRRRSLSERVALSWNDQAQSKSGVLAKVSALSRRVGTGIVDRLCTEAEEALARSLPAAEKIARLRQVQLRKAHERAVEAYIPPRFPGKLTLFRAAIEGDKYEMARDYGWTDLVAELEIITVPGTHLSIFHEENIAGMADAFRDCMSAVTV